MTQWLIGYGKKFATSDPGSISAENCYIAS